MIHEIADGVWDYRWLIACAVIGLLAVVGPLGMLMHQGRDRQRQQRAQRRIRQQEERGRRYM